MGVERGEGFTWVIEVGFVAADDVAWVGHFVVCGVWECFKI